MKVISSPIWMPYADPPIKVVYPAFAEVRGLTGTNRLILTAPTSYELRKDCVYLRGYNRKAHTWEGYLLYDGTIAKQVFGADRVQRAKAAYDAWCRDLRR